MLAPLIPENAPFTAEQRAWLNGFFAGLLSLDGSPAANTALSAGPAAIGAATAAPSQSADALANGEDVEVPWHDPSMPLAERMKLTEGRPLRRRFMAVMAQQDCGQCGYTCEDYANALFLKKEERLNLCVPGGKETQRMLKALYAELDHAAGKPAYGGAVTAAAPAAQTYSPFGAAEAPRRFVEVLDPLQPRLYSISSSPRAMPGRVHLTVDTVRYRISDRERLGVASTFLARIRPGDRLPVYIQRSHGFSLPADPAAPIIMIGPRTSVAPFRAFLHERRAMQASGKSWLFFGNQRHACDFFYENEFSAMLDEGVLSRLSLASSRDQAKKIYVQDRIREEGEDVFRWLEPGAHVFICGDAKRMAPDVERALLDVVARHGNRSEGDAKAYVAGKAGRYHKDVY